MTGYSCNCPDMTGNGWICLEIAESGYNGWTWLKWLEMAGNDWKTAGNGWKQFKMAGNLC